MKFFKKLTNLTFLLVIIGISMMSIGCSKVPAGNVGIKFYLLGQKKGVDCEELTPGRYWIGMNEELYLFPTFTQNYVWTANKAEGSPQNESITFQTKEGMSVNADVGITYRLDPEKVSSIFQRYKKGIEEITDIFMRNMVRDAFVKSGSVREVESVYGIGKSKLLEEVQHTVSDQVKEIGIIIEKIYLVGDMRLPKQVIAALNKKIEATQRAQQRENELREAEAEAKKKIAEAEGTAQSRLRVAEAEAKANKILAASITQTLVDYEQVKKWNGALPQVSGGATPFINLNK